MPGTRCSVGICNNSQAQTGSNPDSNYIKYHRFPKDKEVRQVWIELCRREGNWNPNNCRVCSVHFTPDDYERNLQAELLNLTVNKVLKKDAVPSLLLGRKAETNSAHQKDWADRRRRRRETDSLGNYHEQRGTGATLGDNTKQDPSFEFVSVKIEPYLETGEPALPDNRNHSPSENVVGLCQVKYEIDSDSDTYRSEHYYNPGLTALELKPLDIKSEPYCDDTRVSSESEVLNDNVSNAASMSEDKTVTSDILRRLLLSNRESSALNSDHLQSSSAETPAVVPEQVLPPGSTPLPGGIIPCQETSSRSPGHSDATGRSRRVTLEADDQLYRCEHCGYEFRWKCHLVRHLETHSDDRPFKCDRCNFACKRVNQLNSHTRIHEGTAFRCGRCDFSTVEMSSIRRHAAVHLRGGGGGGGGGAEKRFRCAACAFRTNTRGNLAAHARRHKGNLFGCRRCGFAAAESREVRAHMRAHNAASASRRHP